MLLARYFTTTEPDNQATREVTMKMSSSGKRIIHKHFIILSKEASVLNGLTKPTKLDSKAQIESGEFRTPLWRDKCTRQAAIVLLVVATALRSAQVTQPGTPAHEKWRQFVWRGICSLHRVLCRLRTTGALGPGDLCHHVYGASVSAARQKPAQISDQA